MRYVNAKTNGLCKMQPSDKIMKNGILVKLDRKCQITHFTKTAKSTLKCNSINQ